MEKDFVKRLGLFNAKKFNRLTEKEKDEMMLLECTYNEQLKEFKNRQVRLEVSAY